MIKSLAFATIPLFASEMKERNTPVFEHEGDFGWHHIGGNHIEVSPMVA